MIKLTQYIAPANPDSYLIDMPWCITIEYTKENGNEEFKAVYEPELIKVMLSEEWQDQCKENMGMNICSIVITEEPS